MQDPDAWRTLYCSDDLSEARAVATSVASMDFEVRLREPADPVVSAPPLQTYVVDVRGKDWTDLCDVLDEIILEQVEFDEHLQSRDDRECRVARVCLVVLTATVAVLAVSGAIEL